ncbi:hypothetical protein C8Q80DRAFT_1191184 [Daedaleopsis nitida]|nr:hypothetical protein C8Q80DRAFT_1191184 [Daedaleopsis nitida]
MATNRWSISRLMSGGSHQSSSNSASNSSTPSGSQPQSAQNRSPLTRSHTSNSRHSYTAHRQTPQSSSAAASPSSSSRYTHSNDTRAGASSSQPSNSRVSREQRYAFSSVSSGAVADSMWFAEDFMLGAGMVILQPSSGKVVLLYEAREWNGQTHHYWFLPKGRKDVGESLGQAALREAHEESGYRVSFLPLIIPHNAPEPPHSLDYAGLRLVSEPIFISTLVYGRGSGGRNRHGGEYLTFWYVGQIPADAVVETDTRMADEVGYKTYLLTIEDALPLLNRQLGHIVRTAYQLWLDTLELQAKPEYLQYMTQLRQAEVEDAARRAAETRPVAGPSQGGTAAEAEVHTAGGADEVVDLRMGSVTPGGSGGNGDWEDMDVVTPPGSPAERAASTHGVRGGGDGPSARSGRTQAHAA